VGTATVLAAATAVVFPLAAQANWQPWTNLGGDTLYSGPGFAFTGQVFARNATGGLIMTDPNASTTTWVPVHNGPVLDSPAVLPAREAVPAPTVEVYYRSPDNHIQFFNLFFICHFGGCQWTGNFFGDAGGSAASAPSAVRLLPDRVDLFARGTNGRLQHTWQVGALTDPWAAWEDLGGITFVESPSAVSWQNGNRLDVFVKGGDTRLWHKWWTSAQGWTGWENLGGVLTSAPSVIRFDDTRLDVFAKGTSDTLIHRVWQAGTGWSGWEDLGGRFQYGPAAVKTGDRRIDVYATGSTAQLEHIWWG
jgi:hypothetical protein